jgi:hypothetical protein
MTTCDNRPDPHHLTWKVEARRDSQLTYLRLLIAGFAAAHRLPLSFLALCGANFSIWRAIPLISSGPRPIVEAFRGGQAILRKILNGSNISYAIDKYAESWSGGYYLKNAWYRLREVDQAFGLGVDLGKSGQRYEPNVTYLDLSPDVLAVDRSRLLVWDRLQRKQEELVSALETEVYPGPGFLLREGAPALDAVASGKHGLSRDPENADEYRAASRYPCQMVLLRLANWDPSIEQHKDLMALHLALVGASVSLWKAIDFLCLSPRRTESACEDARAVALKILEDNWVDLKTEAHASAWISGYYLRNAWYRIREVEDALGTASPGCGSTLALGQSEFDRLEPRNLGIERPATAIWPILHSRLQELVVATEKEFARRQHV